jgi:hypothetical protein|tara:strand:- start:73 stop:300 length:228 start_codon:yes stop_codon:yes gene_type:complete
MEKMYKKFVRDGGFLNLLDLFDYKLTAITRATALMELKRIIFSHQKVLSDIDKSQRQFMFIEFRNYLEFDIKEEK